jgi:acyl-coenzyme A synthetase/AMP-(fatty) acid ligase
MIQAIISAAGVVGALGLSFASWLFARSLFPGAAPLISRFAEAEDPATARQPSAQRYLWWLTLTWAATLLVGAFIVAWRATGEAVLTEAFSFIAPLTMAGLLFFGERRVRRKVLGQRSVGPVARQWRIASRILREEAASYLPSSFSRPDPVFRLRDDRRRLLVWRDSECSVAELQAVAIALSASLPPGQRVLVACEDRAVFLWVILAAWAAGRTVVMAPPDLKHAAASPERAQFDCIVTDRSELCANGDTPTLQVDALALRRALGGQPGSQSSAPQSIFLRRSHVVAVFFTSGSTGQPAAQAKTWGQLCDAADAMSRLLQMPDEGPLIGATVVHSHMFGFEMLVMQALRGSTSVYASRIVYPSDLAAFAAIAREKWLVTTPYHLGVFVNAGPLPAGLRRIVSATMPLAVELAAAAEAGTEAEVHEIYGSTEAGCIATRRIVESAVWKLAPDLKLTVLDDGSALLRGTRVGGTLQLRDHIALTDDGFELCGRDTDLVKIAGKRTSLQALTAVLRRIEGVRDGAFIDGAAIGQKRLAAVVVAPGLSSEEIREALAERIDAAFLPRPLVLVDALPRDANGKLRLDTIASSALAAKRESSQSLSEMLRSHAG